VSSFKCEHCGADILDTERGYITGCEHYPLRKIIRIEPLIERERRRASRKLKRIIRFMCQ